MSISKEEFENRNTKGPVIVTFRTRGHALEAWNCVKNILDQMVIPVEYQGRMMESMTDLALALDSFDRANFKLEEAPEEIQ